MTGRSSHRGIGLILFLVFIGLLGTLTAAVAQTPTPTPGGDCCSAHSGSSCDKMACRDCVCDLDPVCCVGGWDVFCVADAQDPVCADACTCTVPTPTPGGDCCSPHQGPSCDDSTCRTCVCGIDSECCTDIWDATCVSEASEECAGSCTCAPPPTETPAPTPTPGGDCCNAHGGTSCDDSACQQCVCALDTPCCNNEWDQTCADEASVECALDCPCQSQGDCCAAHDGVGCDDATCKGCVCGIDADCCTLAWDQTCVDEATVECAASCTCEVAGGCCEQHTDTVGCDNRACQNCVCTLDQPCCAEGWDATCADEAANDCAERCTECAASDCCVARQDPGCNISACESCVCNVDNFCCNQQWDGGCLDIASSDCSSDCQCAGAACPGDCGGDGQVAINDLIVAVGIALGSNPVDACSAVDTNGDGQVGVAELIQAVNAALNGCP